MPLLPRSRFLWRLRSRTLELGRRTLLLGIVNVTPDSFSDGGRFLDPRAACEHALRLLGEGADVVDVGGESTRPNATPVAPNEELERILPVIEAILKARPEAIVSVDTYHAETARRAIEAGVEIVNDVSGLGWDPMMAAVLAGGGVGAILMHTRGGPREWDSLPALRREDVLPLVTAGLGETLRLARAAGVEEDRIVLDPGFGFGKLGADNYALLARLDELRQLRRPLLAGVSRKRFLTGWLEGRPAEFEAVREAATSAAHAAAILGGAHLLRVHDVTGARAAAEVADALLDSVAEKESF